MYVVVLSLLMGSADADVHTELFDCFVRRSFGETGQSFSDLLTCCFESFTHFPSKMSETVPSVSPLDRQWFPW